jgi:hypothetical protein
MAWADYMGDTVRRRAAPSPSIWSRQCGPVNRNMVPQTSGACRACGRSSHTVLVGYTAAGKRSQSAVCRRPNRRRRPSKALPTHFHPRLVCTPAHACALPCELNPAECVGKRRLSSNDGGARLPHGRGLGAQNLFQRLSGLSLRRSGGSHRSETPDKGKAPDRSSPGSSKASDRSSLSDRRMSPGGGPICGLVRAHSARKIRARARRGVAPHSAVCHAMVSVPCTTEGRGAAVPLSPMSHVGVFACPLLAATRQHIPLRPHPSTTSPLFPPAPLPPHEALVSTNQRAPRLFCSIGMDFRSSTSRRDSAIGVIEVPSQTVRREFDPS